MLLASFDCSSSDSDPNPTCELFPPSRDLFYNSTFLVLFDQFLPAFDNVSIEVSEVCCVVGVK